jgi:NADH:ubiquinone oxidoreductase subunit 4 (subunit M)
MEMLLLIAFFLPLYPFSIVLNAVLAQVRHPVARCLLLLIWPQLGLLALYYAPDTLVPNWVEPWALLTSGFYALRLLTARDLDRYAGYLATSSFALTWGLLAHGSQPVDAAWFAFWLSLPVALLALLAGALTRRFGAAYAGLCPGLGSVLPRLSGILVLTTLTAIATPPSPGFFALLDLLKQLDGGAQISLLAIWLTWAWAATQLFQGIVTGSCEPTDARDIAKGHTQLWAATLIAFVVAGLYFTGGGL